MGSLRKSLEMSPDTLVRSQSNCSQFQQLTDWIMIGRERASTSRSRAATLCRRTPAALEPRHAYARIAPVQAENYVLSCVQGRMPRATPLTKAPQGRRIDTIVSYPTCRSCDQDSAQPMRAWLVLTYPAHCAPLWFQRAARVASSHCRRPVLRSAQRASARSRSRRGRRRTVQGLPPTAFRQCGRSPRPGSPSCIAVASDQIHLAPSATMT